MRRTMHCALLALMTLLGSAAGISAQESTPAADPLAGTTIESLGSGTTTMIDDHALVLLRLTLEPGTTIPAHHHPGSVVLYVESGTFGTTFTEGEAVITRAATAAGASATEPAVIGSEMILEEGDSVAYQSDTFHTMSNAGDAPLVLLVSAVLDTSQPGFVFEHDM